MAQTEILKMLSPSAVNPDRLPSGGMPALTQSDVAAMLAGASRPVVLLAYAIHVTDDSSRIQLASHVYSWAAELALSEKWKITRGRPIVRNMSHLAVAETVSPGVCLSCYGNRYISNRVCTNCNGTGRKYPTHEERAIEIDVSECRYYKLWRHRYQRIYEYLQKLGYTLETIVAKNNREEEIIFANA